MERSVDLDRLFQPTFRRRPGGLNQKRNGRSGAQSQGFSLSNISYFARRFNTHEL